MISSHPWNPHLHNNRWLLRWAQTWSEKNLGTLNLKGVAFKTLKKHINTALLRQLSLVARCSSKISIKTLGRLVTTRNTQVLFPRLQQSIFTYITHLCLLWNHGTCSFGRSGYRGLPASKWWRLRALYVPQNLRWDFRELEKHVLWTYFGQHYFGTIKSC
jgi:hypothetical protein